MTRLAEAGISPNDLHFVFIGDPSTPGGVWPNLQADMNATLGPNLTNWVIKFFELNGVLGNVTPDDLYPTTIYTLAGDGVADFQEDFKAGGLLDPLVHLFTTHVEYLGLTRRRSLTRPRRSMATSPMSTSPTTSITSTRGLVQLSTGGCQQRTIPEPVRLHPSVFHGAF